MPAPRHFNLIGLRERGFSLLELMVAMAISLLLLAGVIAVFLSSRSSYETTERFSRIQENGRFALDQLAFDIRSAGYVGCSRSTNVVSTSLKNTTSLLWDFLSGPVRGFESTGAGVWTPTLDTALIPDPAPNNDVLVLRMPRREFVPLKVKSDMVLGANPIVVDDVPDALKAQDVALIYSCEAQAFFRVSSYAGGVIEHNTSLNADESVKYAFRRNAEVVPVNTVIYYVRPSASGIAGATSLWRKVGDAIPEELVEGIELMQIEYGVDTDGDDVANVYRRADAITAADWERVLSVTIAVLVRSENEYGTDVDTRQYTLLPGINAVTFNPPAGDRRLREVFTTTSAIRNRTVID